MSEAFEAKAKLSRQSRLRSIVKGTTLLGSVYAVQLGLLGLLSAESGKLWLLALPVLFGHLIAFLWEKRRERTANTVRIDDHGITFGLKPARALSSIRGVDTDLESERAVRMSDTRGVVTSLTFESRENAEAFVTRLQTVGLPAALSVRFQVRSQTAILVGMVLIVFGLFVALSLVLNKFGLSLPSGTATAIGLVTIPATRFLSHTLRIHADGLELQTIFGTRFVPFSDLGSVTTQGNQVRITTREGKTETSLFADKDFDGKYTARKVADRILAAHQEYLIYAAISIGPQLERGLREGDAWKKIVTAMSPSYREQAYSNDQLAAVVAHRSAAPTARVAAAVKLVKEGGDEAKAKIRIVAAETASPRLRVALEKAANGDMDAALDDAIAAEASTRG